MEEKIKIRGGREHNLKNINLDIPRHKLTVVTGVSGSGKSSLAFSTLYAEGQRRYMESLSSYARQFLGQMDKPDVDRIDGLSPAISIDQKAVNKNPRSTVGTVTEIYDYMRLLFARAGTPHCPGCGREIRKQTTDEMVDQVLSLPERTKIIIEAPVVRGRKGEHRKVLESARKSGFVRVRVDGIIYGLEEEIPIEKNKKHSISIVVDRLIVKDGIRGRLADSLETALKMAEGIAEVSIQDGETLSFSESFSCPDCHISIDEIEPRSFSFNNPFGACRACAGLGYHMAFDEDLVIPDKTLSIDAGAIKAYGWQSASEEGTYTRAVLQALSKRYGFSLGTPFKDYPESVQEKILRGTQGEEIRVHYKGRKGEGDYDVAFSGILGNLLKRYEEASMKVKGEYEAFMRFTPCSHCGGQRLRPEALAVTVNGKNIAELSDLPIKDLLVFLSETHLEGEKSRIGQPILKEIIERLTFLSDVGLDYLSLSRSAGTLSGGESQRIRLATQIGSGLAGVLYILDEPSIGLHQRDNDRLLGTLKSLRDTGNTLVVVEHDADTMREADFIVDVGPGAGVHGGEIVACGSPQAIMENRKSLTGAYLSGRKRIPVPKERLKPRGYVEVLGAEENNLKNVSVKFPVGVMTCVTGVSGSGKSTLVNGILYKALARELNGASTPPGRYKELKGAEAFDKIISIDQAPIGRTPRSNPATYTGVFDAIRDLFATVPEAKARGYKKGRFSFNVKGGRCEACMGDGIKKIEMHFLPDVYVPCEVCGGKRYNKETLEVKYKGKNIYDVLNMTVEEALEFFDNIPVIRRKLQTLRDVGLDYLTLGQPSTELSGGEAQRVKMAGELSKRSTGKTVYILDEPTTGLHFADVDNLTKILRRFTESGNTVIVIEHNLDVIKTADYIIDLGPCGGDGGGNVVACGTPEAVCRVKGSYTGQYLAPLLDDQERSI